LGANTYEHYFNHTGLNVNDSIVMEFDVNDIYPAGELLFLLGFATQNHINLELNSIGGDMNILLIYPAGELFAKQNYFVDNLCFILNNKFTCDSFIWNDEFYPGSSFDIAIKNTQNNTSIEINGFIKIQQKDEIFNLAKFISIGIGLFVGTLCT